MTLQTVSAIDLQFSGSDETGAKLRRLVDALRAAQGAINQLVRAVNTLDSEVNSTTPEGSTLFANPAVQPAFTLSNLIKGTVLKALSETAAAFELLNITELGGQDISNPQEGDYLVFDGGFWRNVTVSGVGGMTLGIDAGTGVGMYAGILSGKIAFKSLIEGAGISIAEVGAGDEVEISATAVASGIAFPIVLAITSMRV